MKRFQYKPIVYSIITIMLLCASCAPSSKVVIYGTNGTEIYNSEYKMLGTISNSGKAKIKLPKNEYVPFLLSHEANSSLYVPFAVNFNNYKYYKNQSTNQDCRFVSFLDNGEEKNIAPTSFSDVTSTITKETTSTIARRKSTVSKRTLNDYAKIVSGTYTGAGYLAQKGKVIEEYAKIKVVILRIDNNNVNVDVFENGESYFSKTNKYQVMKKGKNTYVLSLDGISDALITIDNAGHLTYIHPKVNIDGEIYTLNLTANKK